MALINNLQQLEAAEEAYYNGMEYKGKSGDALLNHIRMFNGSTHKTVDFQPYYGIPNKAKVKKVSPAKGQSNRY